MNTTITDKGWEEIKVILDGQSEHEPDLQEAMLCAAVYQLFGSEVIGAAPSVNEEAIAAIAKMTTGEQRRELLREKLYGNPARA